MKTILYPLLSTPIGALRSRARLHLDLLALRQQLAMVNDRGHKRARFRRRERLFWVCLYRIWPDCVETLAIFKPDTLVRWRRKGFRFYWTCKSRSRCGDRPFISPEIRRLIRVMSGDNGWGAPRIHGELQMLGIKIAQATVAKYMVRPRKPPSQTWRTFLDNHVQDLASVDFFTVPTATLRILYVFVVLRHERRRIVHFNITEHPTEQWTTQQVVEASPFDTAPRYLLRDRVGKYRAQYRSRVHGFGIEEVIIAPRSPWQSPYVERLIGSIRRDCLNHVIVLNESHLERLLNAYLAYYHTARTHLALNKHWPEPRAAQPPELGEVIAFLRTPTSRRPSSRIPPARGLWLAKSKWCSCQI